MPQGNKAFHLLHTDGAYMRAHQGMPAFKAKDCLAVQPVDWVYMMDGNHHHHHDR
jgi:hypothetical protein